MGKGIISDTDIVQIWRYCMEIIELITYLNACYSGDIYKIYEIKT